MEIVRFRRRRGERIEERIQRTEKEEIGDSAANSGTDLARCRKESGGRKHRREREREEEGKKERKEGGGVLERGCV
jgi:hypothetical protein